MKNWFGDKKQRLIAHSRYIIREKAIRKAKAEIALRGKEVEDFSELQLETIVQEQEENIIASYKNKTFVALLILLGLS